MVKRNRARSRIIVAAAASLVVGLVSPKNASAEPRRQNLPVIELFTSQGCSSCPPADNHFRAYADRSDLVALTFAVDYWDYLGWKDTLASPKFTARQKDYAKARGDGEVYTPQVVINGAAHVVGSDKRRIDTVLAAKPPRSTAAVAINCRSTRSTAVVEISGAPLDEPPARATVWLAVVRPTVVVEIRKGENTGKTVTYSNVVRDLMPIGTWTGAPMSIEVARKALYPAPDSRLAVLVQDEKTGRILAAGWLATAQSAGG